MKRKAANDNVEASVRIGKCIGAAFVPMHVEEATLSLDRARLIEHGLGNIDAGCRSNVRCKCRNHRTGPAGDVEKGVARLRLGRLEKRRQSGVIMKRRRTGKCL